MYERNCILLDHMLREVNLTGKSERSRLLAATKLEIRISLNGDERMKIPTTQKNLIL